MSPFTTETTPQSEILRSNIGVRSPPASSSRYRPSHFKLLPLSPKPVEIIARLGVTRCEQGHVSVTQFRNASSEPPQRPAGGRHADLRKVPRAGISRAPALLMIAQGTDVGAPSLSSMPAVRPRLSPPCRFHSIRDPATRGEAAACRHAVRADARDRDADGAFGLESLTANRT
jgi:hypothetical protein